jgi:hypothetical protein
MDITPKRVILIEPEFMLGKNIRIYDNFPESDYRKNFVLSIGILNIDTSKHWLKYYNFPTVGISLSYSNLGNDKILRDEYAIIPYIILKTSRNQKKSFDFKIGLGASYFNNPFHPKYNPKNQVIGSKFNWTFQLFLYKKVLVTNRLNLKVGFGYLHSSNSHTAIPNYGLNSAMISLAAQFTNKSYDPEFAMKHEEITVNKKKYYFIQSRLGYGWHELGGTTVSYNDQVYPITTYALCGGIILKQHLKFSLGMSYRFYKSFHEYILNNPIRGFGENPTSEASNITVFAGVELLIGHIGMDLEVGYNIHKPFYREFNNLWDYSKDFRYWRNKHIATRFGLKFYLISNEKLPKHNVFFGSHINANFGKADFMDLSIGYTYLFK